MLFLVCKEALLDVVGIISKGQHLLFFLVCPKKAGTSRTRPTGRFIKEKK